MSGSSMCYCFHSSATTVKTRPETSVSMKGACVQYSRAHTAVDVMGARAHMRLQKGHLQLSMDRATALTTGSDGQVDRLDRQLDKAKIPGRQSSGV